MNGDDCWMMTREWRRVPVSKSGEGRIGILLVGAEWVRPDVTLGGGCS